MEEILMDKHMFLSSNRTKRFSYKKELMEKYGNKCGYCGCEIVSPELMEVDSYLPFRTHKEQDTKENFVLSCPLCHRIKGAREPITEDGTILILHPYKDNYWTNIKVDENGSAQGVTPEGKSTVDIMHLNRAELVAYRANNIASFMEEVNDGKRAIEVYQDAINNIRKLLIVQDKDSELSVYYNRLLYANVIAAMESYLSRIIIGCVIKNENVFWKFVKTFQWEKDKFSISEIKEVYDGMNMRVQTALSEVLYHNLQKVKRIYQVALDIEILKDKVEMEYLCKAVDIRHDIVHRNGRKKSKSEAEEYHNISVEMIEELISHIDNLVKSIEKQIADNGYVL